MSGESLVTLSNSSEGVATLTLNRPEKHNALTSAFIAELHEVADAIRSDRSIRVVVLTGAGRSFCAGADLDWMRAQFAADRGARLSEARRLALMLDALNTLPQPLIGRINGQAFGGGIGLMSICDVVIVAQGARFALTETRLGLIPATISPYVLARMGEGRARAVFMSARFFDAAEAVSLGLVHRIAPPDALDREVEKEAACYLDAAPGAVAAAKALARSLGPRIDSAVIEDTVARLADTWETEEARQGIAAFFERRSPPWAVGGDRRR